jgi:hypothetical protein
MLRILQQEFHNSLGPRSHCNMKGSVTWAIGIYYIIILRYSTVRFSERNHRAPQDFRSVTFPLIHDSAEHRVDRVLGFFSNRPNWDPPSITSSPRRRVCSLPLWFRGRETHSLAVAGEWVGGGGGGVPIRTRGQT